MTATAELRFEGASRSSPGPRRGLGRSYANLLAWRGANDIGGAIDGSGADAGPAAEAADEIQVAGGTALADLHDVATAAGASALVDVAVERFGRIDVLVNDAGIMRWGGLPDVDAADLEAHLAVHTEGSFHTARAAWPRVRAPLSSPPPPATCTKDRTRRSRTSPSTG